MKIGYQGMEGSNSEEAALVLAKQYNIIEPIFVPLVSSLNVVNALRNKEIDLGVVATKNTLAGEVLETKEAIKHAKLEELAFTSLQIHHCLFIKNKDININSITEVVSHIHALNQTKEHLRTHFPHMNPVEIEDTAIGAKRLAKGEISDKTAVICRKNAGEMFNLYLVKENIEDSQDNFTDFTLFKL